MGGTNSWQHVKKSSQKKSFLKKVRQLRNMWKNDFLAPQNEEFRS